MEDASGFDWDEANTQHIARHDVGPGEAEEVIQNDPMDLGSETVNGEERMVSLGITAEGRILVVVTAMRGARIRVVTAYRPGKRLRLLYLEQKGFLYHA